MGHNLVVGLFWTGLALLLAGLILRYLFPKYDRYKDEDIEDLFDNDQDDNLL